MRFLDRFDVLLLDMNGTFMFGHDRFGPGEDYAATYHSLGGRRLSREALLAIMQPTCAALLAIYERVDRFDDFPSLAEAFREYGGATERDLPLLERVFAAHELGTVPAEHLAFLRELSTTHRLGVVSNLCSHPDVWLPQFDGTGVFQLFTSRVFSSEGRSIKPSPNLFRRALAAFPTEARVLFVGDSLERDIVPAKALGLRAAWIAPEGSTHSAADVVVGSLPDLGHLAD